MGERERRAAGSAGSARAAVGAVGLLLLAGTSLATAVGAADLAAAGWPSLRADGAGDPAEAVLCLVWATVAGLAGWLALGLLACLAAAAPGAVGRAGRRAAGATTPAVLRRLASSALGGALLVGGLAPVVASAAGSPPVTVTAPAPSPGSPQLAGTATWAARVAQSGLSPDLTPTTPPVTPTPAPAATGRPPTSLGALAPAAPRALQAPGRVVVAPGDCLWGIAAAHLPTGTDVAGVARATADWYATNRAVVGPDPDHIEPGQVLRAPDQAGGR